MWRLEYYVNNRLIETPVVCAPYGVCKWKRDLMQESTHKLGTFKIVKQ